MSKIQISQIVSREMTLTAQFKIDMSRLISKLSVIRSLKLLVTESTISKCSKEIVQSYCNMWPETADSFTS